MNRTGSIVMYFVGLAVVVAAIWILLTETGLADFIPITIVAAVVLLIVGIAIMASSDRLGFRDRAVVDERAAPPTAPRSSYEREVRYDDETRYP